MDLKALPEPAEEERNAHQQVVSPQRWPWRTDLEWTLPAVESWIRTLQERQIELIGLATAEGARFEDYDEEIGHVNGEKMWLLGIKVKLKLAQQPQAAFERRMEEIDAALSQESAMIEESMISEPGSCQQRQGAGQEAPAHPIKGRN